MIDNVQYKLCEPNKAIRHKQQPGKKEEKGIKIKKNYNIQRIAEHMDKNRLYIVYY